MNLAIPNEELFENAAKDEVDLLLDRERKYAEEYLRMEKFKQKESMDSRLKSNVEKYFIFKFVNPIYNSII